MTDHPTPAIESVCVYCASSANIDPAFTPIAQELGKLIAQHIGTLVFGGNAVGLMKTVADSVKQHNGRVIGITPQLMHDRGITYPKCDQLLITPDMRTRKAKMEQLADAFITLPGGLGTLEELFETLTHRQLGYHNKPIVIINALNFFDPLNELLEHMREHRFAKPESANLCHTAPDPKSAIDYLLNHTTPQPTDKWS